jgi:hypothetical protein
MPAGAPPTCKPDDPSGPTVTAATQKDGTTLLALAGLPVAQWRRAWFDVFGPGRGAQSYSAGYPDGTANVANLAPDQSYLVRARILQPNGLYVTTPLTATPVAATAVDTTAALRGGGVASCAAWLALTDAQRATAAQAAGRTLDPPANAERVAQAITARCVQQSVDGTASRPPNQPLLPTQVPTRTSPAKLVGVVAVGTALVAAIGRYLRRW